MVPAFRLTLTQRLRLSDREAPKGSAPPCRINLVEGHSSLMKLLWVSRPKNTILDAGQLNRKVNGWLLT